MTIEGFNTGDRAFAAWVVIDKGYPVAETHAVVYITEVEVVLPEAGVLRPIDGAPRMLFFGERLFASAQEAREWVAAQVAAGAARLAKQAAELAEPAVVTV
jgi:hypothetical protein